MVGSPFILIDKNGQRGLLNTAQITYVSDKDVRLTPHNRAFYKEFSPEQEMAYTLVVEFTDSRPMNYLYDKKEERDAMLDKLIEALAPSLTIVSPPGLPMTWPEIAQQEPKPKIVYNGYTGEDIDHAMAMLHVLQAREQPQPTAPPVAPAPKPARKPGKPKE
jgi:hypothetical protein